MPKTSLERMFGAVGGRAFAVVLALALPVFLMLRPVAAAEDAPRPYSFGIVPQFEAMRLVSIWEPILQELEARTGYEFVISGTRDIPTFEQEFLAGSYDFAYMNPYHATLAMDQQGYQPIVRDGGRALFGVLVVRDDNPAQTPGDLDDPVIAFPAPNALGASLMMRAELTNLFKVAFQSRYASTHSSAYLNVVLGRVAAAGGVMATLGRQPDNVRERLRVIHETGRVPPHPVMAHPRVPEAVQLAVRDAFLGLAAEDAGQALLAEIPMRQAVAAKAQDYDAVRALSLDEFVE